MNRSPSPFRPRIWSNRWAKVLDTSTGLILNTIDTGDDVAVFKPGQRIAVEGRSIVVLCYAN